MASSNFVAALSVITTGVISPVIAMLGIRWQVLRTKSISMETERRQVLDEAIVEVARYMRATSQVRSLWRHGHFDDTEEGREQIRTRASARQGIVAASGRICLRFGPDSDVATTYANIDSFMEAIDMLLRPYRRHENLPLTMSARWEIAIRNWYLHEIFSSKRHI